MQLNNAADHTAVEQRYLELYEELQSRAFAVSWGLSRTGREEFQQEAAHPLFVGTPGTAFPTAFRQHASFS